MRATALLAALALAGPAGAASNATADLPGWSPGLWWSVETAATGLRGSRLINHEGNQDFDAVTAGRLRATFRVVGEREEGRERLWEVSVGYALVAGPGADPAAVSAVADAAGRSRETLYFRRADLRLVRRVQTTELMDGRTVENVVKVGKAPFLTPERGGVFLRLALPLLEPLGDGFKVTPEVFTSEGAHERQTARNEDGRLTVRLDYREDGQARSVRQVWEAGRPWPVLTHGSGFPEQRLVASGVEEQKP